MPWNKRWLAILLVLAVSAGIGVTATADSGTEGEFLSLINSTRSGNGLGSLQMEGNLQAHARQHTADMIAAGDIYHSSSAELSAAGGSGWSKIGENVGRGSSPSSLHQAFMNSSGHKANILGDYNYVGIGTGYADDGTLYVTVVFMKKGETAPPPTEAPPATEAPPPAETPPAPESPPPPAAPGPAPTTSTTTSTTTTVPATTTTSLIVPPDRPVTPGLTCLQATRYSNICHD